MRKIVIILFILLFSFNVQAARLDKIVDLFEIIIEWIDNNYLVKQTLIRIDRFFRYDAGYNEFVNENKELIKINLYDYISKKNIEYNEDLKKLTTHQFNNFDINNKQKDSLNIIKNYLKLKNYKNFKEDKTFLICRDSKEYFSFFFYFNENFITMNKAITRHRFTIDDFLFHEMIVAVPYEENRLIVMPSIESKADNSFENWYFFYINEDKLYFKFVKGQIGISTVPLKRSELFDAISSESLQNDNYCLINDY